MTKFLLALLLSLVSFVAQAQSCVPKTFWTPFGTGSDWKYGDTTVEGVTVAWNAWWCPSASGEWTYFIHRCVVGRACMDARTLRQKLDTAARSPDFLAAVQAEIRANSMAPLDSEREAISRALFDAWDAIQPIKPPSTAVTWVTGGSLAVYSTSGSTLGRVLLGKKAPANTGCVCPANPITVSGATYCPWVGGPPNEVTYCKRAQ